jgi:hypothetical protein
MGATESHIADGAGLADTDELQAGRRYIIRNNLGRKLIWVCRFDGHTVWFRRLRATAKKWTHLQKEPVTQLWLQGIRRCGREDIDLIKAASAAVAP